MNHLDQIWEATKTGKYPPGTTADDLLNLEDKNGATALHLAVIHNHLPPQTTAQHLAAARNKYSRTALHAAAQFGHYPINTTNADLVQCVDKDGNTPLHDAARFRNLLPNTTSQQLKQPKNKHGSTPWSHLCFQLMLHPSDAFDLPPQLFEEEPHVAIEMVQQTIKTTPKLTATATIWLGRVFAEATKNQVLAK